MSQASSSLMRIAIILVSLMFTSCFNLSTHDRRPTYLNAEPWIQDNVPTDSLPGVLVNLQREDSASTDVENVTLSLTFWRYPVDTTSVEFTSIGPPPPNTFSLQRVIDYEFHSDSLQRDISVDLPGRATFLVAEGTYLIAITMSFSEPYVIRDVVVRAGYLSVLNLSEDDFVWIWY